jgi:hypothetical protein
LEKATEHTRLTDIANTPPIKGSGIVANNAANLVNRPKQISIIEAICIMKRDATFVIDTTATFSLYVVMPIQHPNAALKSNYFKTLLSN